MMRLQQVFISVFIIVVFSRVAFGGNIQVSKLCEKNQKICFVRNFNLSTSDLDVIQFGDSSGIEGIVIRDSALASIPAVSANSNKIKLLVIERCNLKNFTRNLSGYSRSLQTLILSNNQIGEVPNKVFNQLIKLEDLRLGSNYVTKLYSNSFFGAGKVKYLDLSNNYIRELPNDLLSSLLSLEYIDLSFNRIEKIDNTVFEQNLKLQTILLANNRIIVFEGNSLKHLPRLNILDISFNAISEIHTQSVNFLVANDCALSRCYINGSVISLSLENNKLSQLDISDISHTTELRLHNNLFASLSSFTGMHNLVNLDLSYNHQIESLEVDALYQFPNLKSLNLTSTHLTNLTKEHFTFQDELFELDLSQNFLHINDFEIFTEAKKLRKLYLNGNNLTMENIDMKSYLPDLETFGLNFNDLTCAKLTKIMEYLSANRMSWVQDEYNEPETNPCGLLSPSETTEIDTSLNHDLPTEAADGKHSVAYYKRENNLIAILVITTLALIIALFLLRITRCCKPVAWRALFRGVNGSARTHSMRLHEDSDSV